MQSSLPRKLWNETPPPPAPAPSQGRWLTPGEKMEIAGFRYDGGMIYLGKILKAPSVIRRGILTPL
jgi:hypothetical protein